MTKEELEKATGQELIEQRDYCGVDGYYGDYLDDVNAEMLKRFNRLAELEKRCANYEMTISKMEKGTCDICKETEKDKKIEALEQQIEKMKSDVMANIKWADKNCDNMWQKLVKMWNQWEIKENDN